MESNQAIGVDQTGRPNFAKRVGMREVAQRAGVATSSVSRVISEHPDVSEAMRARVLAAIDELGFRPDMLAQSLRTGASMTVGFVVADIGNQLFAQIVMGAETTLSARGYSVIVANAFADSTLAIRNLEAMTARRVDGLLVSVADEQDQQLRTWLASATLPIALIDREIEGLPATAVLSDHATGTRAAIEHLLELGHRRIALINGPAGVRPSRERAATLHAVAAEHGELEAMVETGSFSAEHGHDATLSLMRRERYPTAIISGSNQILVGVLRALRGLDLSIPADVSLVTCDEVALAEFLSPPLSTVARDPARMGEVAAKLVLAQLEGGERGAEIVLPTAFHATASCAPPPIGRTRR